MQSSGCIVDNTRPNAARLNMPTHNIPHVWSVRRCKNPNKRRCMVCSGTMGFLSAYEKCRSCKGCIHTECKGRTQDNCGLTQKHLKEFLTHMVISARQDKWAPNIGTSKSMNDMPVIQFTDPQTPIIADSSSSTNSSAPSTPAFVNVGQLPNIYVHPPPAPTLPVIDRLAAHPPKTADLPTRSKQFTFPDVIVSNSTDSDGESVHSSTGSGGFSSSNRLRRRAWNMFTLRHGSISWKDVTIPVGEIKFDQIIGSGRFGDVNQVDHFGTVAIKYPKMDHVEEDRQIEVFKQETSCYQNARHENLIFFCGYTMDLGKLGIVTERIRGPSLYNLMHGDALSDEMDFNDIVDYAKQICQGMSYLHTKHIIHKDLRSKNIFLESKKIIITDYSLFNVKRLAYPPRKNGFLLSERWLCYQAPEVLKSLTPTLDPLSFSDKSDIYAFGTVWYEFLARKFPFDGLDAHQILWQVGVGMKPWLGKMSCCREAKVLFMQCWAYDPQDRKGFVDIFERLEAMPRRALRRSPSFPACKSFESTF